MTDSAAITKRLDRIEETLTQLERLRERTADVAAALGELQDAAVKVPETAMDALLTEDADDPRHRVTETGFRVHPELLDRPLAHPMRRLAAMLIDLSVIGTIAVTRFISPWLVVLVGAWLLWRIADPGADVRLSSDLLRTSFRWTAVATAATAIIVLVAGMFSDDSPPADPGGTRPAALSPAVAVQGSTSSDSPTATASPSDSAGRAARRIPAPVHRLRSAPSNEAARDRAAGLALGIYRGGAPRDVVEDSVDDVVEEALDELEADHAWLTAGPQREVERDGGLFEVDLPHPAVPRRWAVTAARESPADLLGGIGPVTLSTFLFGGAEQHRARFLLERTPHPRRTHLQVALVGLGLLRPVALRSEHHLIDERLVGRERLFQQDAQRRAVGIIAVDGHLAKSREQRHPVVVLRLDAAPANHRRRDRIIAVIGTGDWPVWVAHTVQEARVESLQIRQLI